MPTPDPNYLQHMNQQDLDHHIKILDDYIDVMEDTDPDNDVLDLARDASANAWKEHFARLGVFIDDLVELDEAVRASQL